jgi:hypothetical protein
VGFGATEGGAGSDGAVDRVMVGTGRVDGVPVEGSGTAPDAGAGSERTAARDMVGTGRLAGVPVDGRGTAVDVGAAGRGAEGDGSGTDVEVRVGGLGSGAGSFTGMVERVAGAFADVPVAVRVVGTGRVVPVAGPPPAEDCTWITLPQWQRYRYT